MASIPSIIGNLAFILFLLIPGYVCLRGYLHGAIEIDKMSRFDKLSVVIIGGTISLVVISLTYRYLLPLTTSFSISDCRTVVTYTHPHPVSIQTCSANTTYESNGGIHLDDVEGLSVLKGSVIIGTQSIVGAFFGSWYGKYRYELKESPQTREELVQPWERAYEIAEVGTEVRIITKQDREISGTLQQMGSPSEDYDILLANPREITRAPDRRIIHDKPVAQFSYHHYRDISRIELGSPDDDDIYDPEGDTKGVQTAIGELKRREESLREVTPVYRQIVNILSYLCREKQPDTGAEDVEFNMEEDDT